MIKRQQSRQAHAGDLLALIGVWCGLARSSSSSRVDKRCGLGCILKLLQQLWHPGDSSWSHHHYRAPPPRVVTCRCCAQVYKAVLRDSGEEVAVKVQRPGIEPVILRDLFIFRTLGSLFNTLSRQVGVPGGGARGGKQRCYKWVHARAQGQRMAAGDSTFRPHTCCWGRRQGGGGAEQTLGLPTVCWPQLTSKIGCRSNRACVWWWGAKKNAVPNGVRTRAYLRTLLVLGVKQTP